MKIPSLNNRGFAVSIILYSAVTLLIIILFLILSILSTELNNKKVLTDDIKESVSGKDKSNSESLGFITITSSDNKNSSEWHKSSFNLSFSEPINNGKKYSFPVIYYYGTDLNNIDKKITGTELNIAENMNDVTYYIKACKSGNISICTNVTKYIVKIDTNMPTITVAGESTEWNSSRKLTVTPTSLSGIAYYEYYVTDWDFEPDSNNDLTKVSTDTFEVTQTGKYIYIRAINNAGNSSSWLKYNLYVGVGE